MSIITADLQNRGETIRLSMGDTLELRLPENPTTGYRWMATTIDVNILAEGSHEYGPLVSNAMGAGRTRTLRFHALTEGHTPLALTLCQAWEPDQTEDAYRLSVIVTQ